MTKKPNNIIEAHWDDLQKSGLNQDTIKKANLRSIEKINKKEYFDLEKKLGFPIDRTIESFLEFPYSENYSRYKIFPPPKDKNGRKIKYLQARKSGVALYKPPNNNNNQNEIITIVEGEKKTLKAIQEGLCCYGISGAWNWKEKDSDIIPELELMPMKKVELVPDNDFRTSSHVAKGFYFLGEKLNELGAEVSFVLLPEDKNKMGLDDFLLSNSIGEYKKLERVTLEAFSEFTKEDPKINFELVENVLTGISNPCGVFYTNGLPDVLKNYVDLICSSTESDPITVTMSVICMISGFLKKKIYIPKDDYESEPRKVYFQDLYPNIWSLVIHDSGQFKTTGLEKGCHIGYKKSDEIEKEIKQLEEKISELSIGVGKREKKEKEREIEGLQQKIHSLKIKDPFLPKRTTAEGLISMLQDGYAGTITLSEFGSWLQSMEKSYNLDLKSTFTDFYDVPKTTRTYTKTDKMITVNHPYISICGVSTMDWIKENIDIHDVSSGFFARFLLFSPPSKKIIPPAMPIRRKNVNKIAREALENILFHEIHNIKYCLSNSAYELFNDLHQELYTAFENEEMVQTKQYLDPYLKRWSPYILKLAMIFQFLENKNTEEIENSAIMSAYQIINYAMKSTLFLFKQELGESKHQLNCRKILEFIAKRIKGGKKAKWADITSSYILKGGAKDYENVITHLMESGKIEMIQGNRKKDNEYVIR